MEGPSRQGVFAFPALVSVPALVVLPLLAEGPLGLGAVEAGGVAELVGGAELLSDLAASLLGAGDPVCDVGVHATSAARKTAEAAAMRR